MTTRSYVEQATSWPSSGRHVLARHDAESIVVYQAYKPAIASFAVENQRFGGDFSFSRMSWIKPGFLWMMYRSGWGTKDGQERVLAVTITRSFFDEALRRSVSSQPDVSGLALRACWSSALKRTDVVLQWDPDHDPAGRRTARRAVQIGLRGDMLRRYAEEEIVSIEDISEFVSLQRANATGSFERLVTPAETVYVPGDPAAALAAGLDSDARP